MPTRAPKPCKKPGCPRLNCSEHSQRRPDLRLHAAQRGYDRRWQRLRLMFLRRNPVCATLGCGQAATDVHHKLAKRDGGKDQGDNLQALCHSCHSKLTASGG